MKTRQLELRAIPQFDSGRWKLRLERVPVHPDNETKMGVDFDSAAQARVNETASSTLVPVRKWSVWQTWLCEMPVFKRLRKIV